MKISEHFYSLQGEGLYAGVPSYFIRFFGCTLQCQGFGQANPADPTTWKTPWKDINIDEVKRVEDLPKEIYEYGCDSVYSWAKKFKNLQIDYTPAELVEQMRNRLGEEKFKMLLNGEIHIVLTGGEPLMRHNQEHITDLLKYLNEQYGAEYLRVTIETNATVELNYALQRILTFVCTEVLFSCSPKLLHTSGEPANRAIKPDVLYSFEQVAGIRCTPVIQGKFVLANTDEAKEELLRVVRDFNFSFVYLMPEGPNKHRVNDSATDIAEFAMAHGFRFTHRLHNLLWDNKIGV